jgi:hypothetical protein
MEQSANAKNGAADSDPHHTHGHDSDQNRHARHQMESQSLQDQAQSGPQSHDEGEHNEAPTNSGVKNARDNSIGENVPKVSKPITLRMITRKRRSTAALESNSTRAAADQRLHG